MANPGSQHVVVLTEPLRVLTAHQITQIDRFLSDVDAFGRITLIKQKGRLRFIEKTESMDAERPEHIP